MTTTLGGTLITQATVPGTDVRIRIRKVRGTAGNYEVSSVNVVNPADENYMYGQETTEEFARILANEYWTLAVERRDRKAAAVAERRANAATLLRGVPAGRYAVDVDGKLGFFKVDRPTEGRWAGAAFVTQQVSDAEYPVRGGRKNLVLAAVAANPQAASMRYGREIGKCGVCGRTLTNEESRAAGIGPICRGELGW